MASSKVLEKKQAIVKEISNNIENSQTVVFFEYSGLSVVELTELRKKLRDNASEFKVYKNTLTKRALETLKIDLKEPLVGPKAMAFGKDVIAPIKILNDFAKKHKSLSMNVGIVEGKITTHEVLKELSKTPSRDVLLTQLASGLMGVVHNLSVCLDLYSQKLEN